MTNPIPCWIQPDWVQATAAVLAVIGAVIVGWRQNKIISKQVELQEQEIRVSLLDRRLQVYDDVHSFFSEVLRNWSPAKGETERHFLRAKLNARFLFSEELNHFLSEVWQKHCDLVFHTEMTKSGNATNEEEHLEHVKLRSELVKWFADAFGRLPEHFSEIRPL